MNVLSLFDGMSCGRVALERAGIPVTSYYASEVDKYAIKVAEANWPDNVNVGDVCLINTQMLPKIDLLIGGSPCQGFSFAGKQLNFNDPRSALFFEFVHKLNELKPKYFLLENVKMKQEYQDIITEYLGVEPIVINSSLVSAQNRVRYYWTNIPGVEQPEDRETLLIDVLEKLPTDNVGAQVREKSKCVRVAGRGSLITSRQEWDYPYIKTDKKLGVKKNQGKASCLTDGANSGGNHSDMDILAIEPDVCRRYSITECERLQTLPDRYTQNKGVSNSQCYKMLGNGWTVDVVAHIFGYLEAKA